MQTLQKISLSKIDVGKKKLFFLSRVATDHGFNLNLRFLHDLKHKVRLFNPIKVGREKKSVSTSFFHLTSTDVGVSSQNFLTFSFNPFDSLMPNFKVISSASPKLLNRNQDHYSKKKFFGQILIKLSL